MYKVQFDILPLLRFNRYTNPYKAYCVSESSSELRNYFLQRKISFKKPIHLVYHIYLIYLLAFLVLCIDDVTVEFAVSLRITSLLQKQSIDCPRHSKAVLMNMCECITWFQYELLISIQQYIMMTSSNGNIFRLTGHLCGEFTGPGEFPTQRPVTRSFDVFFDLRLNKRLSKQSWGWWFETLPSPLWRHSNDIYICACLMWCTLYRWVSARKT